MTIAMSVSPKPPRCCQPGTVPLQAGHCGGMFSMFRVPLNQQVALQHRQLHFKNGMQEAGGPEMEKLLGSNRLAQEHEVTQVA